MQVSQKSGFLVLLLNLNKVLSNCQKELLRKIARVEEIVLPQNFYFLRIDAELVLHKFELQFFRI